MSGKFIVIEGGDGTGKSACKRYVEEKLAGAPVIFTHEPGGTPVGQEIREVLLKPREGVFDPLAELFLFAASRAQHLRERIAPALARGESVICDRFAASSFAYQVRGNERPDLAPIFYAVHEAVLAETKPDLYILLDLDPGLAEERMNGRGEKNRLDAKERAYHTRVRAGFLEYLAGWPTKIVDASRPLAEVREAVWQIVARELNHDFKN